MIEKEEWDPWVFLISYSPLVFVSVFLGPHYVIGFHYSHSRRIDHVIKYINSACNSTLNASLDWLTSPSSHVWQTYLRYKEWVLLHTWLNSRFVHKKRLKDSIHTKRKERKDLRIRMYHQEKLSEWEVRHQQVQPVCQGHENVTQRPTVPVTTQCLLKDKRKNEWK